MRIGCHKPPPIPLNRRRRNAYGARYIESLRYANSSIHLPKKAAGHRRQQCRAGKAVLTCQRFPASIGEGIRHPNVAAISIVFDNEQASIGLEIATHQLQHAILLAQEVERVRHHNPIKRRYIELPGKILIEVVDSCAGETGSHSSFLLPQRTPIFVHRIDDARRSEQVGECQRKGSCPGTKISPYSTFSRYTLL